jgi:Domain of unknown function (DUF4442)
MPGYRSELTDLRVFLTLASSVFRDFTVSRCPLSVFFSCLSDFLFRFTALRRVSSRRSTARNTFCAAVALAAGEVADRLPLALRLAVAFLAVAVLALRDRVLGRVLVAFFFEVAAEAVRRAVRFFVLLLRVDVVDLVAMTLSFTLFWMWISHPVALVYPVSGFSRLDNTAEIAMRILMEATVPASHRWIPKAMTVQYLEKGTTSSRAQAHVDPPAFSAVTEGVELVITRRDCAQIAIRA